MQKSRWIITLIACSVLSGCGSFQVSTAVNNDDGLASPGEVAIENIDHSRDIWEMFAADFHMPYESQNISQVRGQMNWYLTHGKFLRHVADQAKPYLYYIYQQVKHRNLPAELALLPLLESAFNPYAYSRAGAVGLWQMMPGTASVFGLKMDSWYDGRRDIIVSTNAALNYLSYLGNLFNNDWLLALAAYNSGEGTVNNAIQRNAKEGLPTDFWHLRLPLETKSYVPKLLALATIVKNIDRYPLELPKIPYVPYLAKVAVPTDIDLSQVAKLAGMSEAELAHLNPGFNKSSPGPTAPHWLVFPVDKASSFKANYENLPDKAQVSVVYYASENDSDKVNVLSSDKNSSETHYETYTVKHGDTIAKIAKKYHISINAIKKSNNRNILKSLHAGRKIKIPVKTNKIKVKKNIIIKAPAAKVVNINNNVVYHVKSGDTIFGIAKHFGISAKILKKANNIKSDSLSVGKKIEIPANTQNNKKIVTDNVSAEPVKIAQKHLVKTTVLKKIVSTKKNEINNKKYIVQSNDTISSIAQKFKVSADDIIRWNQISDPSVLKPYQVLVIYKK